MKPGCDIRKGASHQRKEPNYDVRELQKRLLGIVVDFDRVCREHQLRYYVTYGSMLGAVRHRGFIPWDDDIDLGMPRDDYDRLIAHSREWLPPHLEFVCGENDDAYPIAFGKLQDIRTTIIERRHLHYLGGIFVDIMPIDGICNNALRQRLHIAHYVFWSRVLYFIHRDPYRHGRGPSSWLPLLCRRLFTMTQVQARIRKILMRYPYRQSQFVCLYDDHSRAIMPKSVVGEPETIVFEGVSLPGVHDADAYLRAVYGSDYMQLPPENMRKIHCFDYLDLNNPYRNYNENSDC